MIHRLRLLLFVFGVGCTGGSDAERVGDGAASERSSSVAPAALVERSWQVRMTDATLRERFETSDAWGAVFQSELPQAIVGMGDDSQGRARLHASYA
ncbi:MAG: hypothetical protein AAFV53_40640, partial [Myxococcota bacterium]